MTHPTRRTALGLLTSAAAITALPRRAIAGGATDLVAGVTEVQLAPVEYPATRVWAYGGDVPGRTIRLTQGERLTRRFRNDLPEPSTVHWHGVRVPNAMDGVAGLTQDTVRPGETFLYHFDVPDAGTYWYHSHHRGWEQVARGLSGALIVDEADGGPDVDADEVLLIDDWRLTEEAQISDDFGALHDWAHGGRIGNWITVNGDGAWTRPVRRHQRLRLRLINAANARIFTLDAEGLEGWIVALDGMPLDTPKPFAGATLAPAQRIDLVVDVTAEAGEEAFLVSRERDGGYALAAFPVDGVAAAARRGTPAALPPNPVPALGEIDGARLATLHMEGGAMGALEEATLGDERLGMRELAAAGKVWALNGRADMPETPLIEAGRGETVRLALRNDTAWPHGMHLHGHHFRQIGPDGSFGPLRDTLLVERAEQAEIAFVADTPGDWLLHCHMLEHAAGGMTTWIRVTG